MKSLFKLLILSGLSLNFLVGCGDDDAEKAAKLRAKWQLAYQEHYECVAKTVNYTGKGCEKLEQESDRLKKEYEQLVKKL